MSNENDSLNELLESCDHNSPECVSRLLNRLKQSEKQLASIRNDQEQLLRLQQWTEGKVNMLSNGRSKKTTPKTHNLNQINNVRAAVIDSGHVADAPFNTNPMTSCVDRSSMPSNSSSVVKHGHQHGKSFKSVVSSSNPINPKGRSLINDRSNETAACLRNLSHSLQQLQMYIEQDMLTDPTSQAHETVEQSDSDNVDEPMRAISIFRDNQLRIDCRQPNAVAQHATRLKKVQNRSKLNLNDVNFGKLCNRTSKANVRPDAQQVSRTQQQPLQPSNSIRSMLIDRYEADGSEEEDTIINGNRQNVAANAFVQSFGKHRSGTSSSRNQTTSKIDFNDLAPQKYLKRSDQNINRLVERPAALSFPMANPISSSSSAFAFPDSQVNPLLTSQQLLNCVLQQNVTLLQQQQALLIMCQRLQCQLLGYEQPATGSHMRNTAYTSQMSGTNSVHFNGEPSGPASGLLIGQHPHQHHQMSNVSCELWANSRLTQSPNDSLHASTPLLGPANDSVFKASATLNNQVAPGQRANNFVDNFRSQSRHNQLNGGYKSNQGRNNNRASESISTGGVINTQITNCTRLPSSNGLTSCHTAGAVSIEEHVQSPFSSLGSSAGAVSNSKFHSGDTDSGKKCTNREVFAQQPSAAQITLLYEMLQKLLDEKKDTGGAVKAENGISFDEPMVGVATADVNGVGADLGDALVKSFGSVVAKGRSKKQISPLLAMSAAPPGNACRNKVSRTGDSSMMTDHSSMVVVGTQYTRPLMAADGQSCEPASLPPSVGALSGSAASAATNLYLTRPELLAGSAARSFVTRPVASERCASTDNDRRPEASQHQNTAVDEEEDDDDDEEEELDEETDEQQGLGLTESDVQPDDLNVVNVSFVDSPSATTELTARRLDLHFEAQIVNPAVSPVNEIRLSGDGEQGL